MEIRIKFEPDQGTDSGVCKVFRHANETDEEIGYVVYSNKKELAWIHEVMLENHPNVCIID